MYKNAETIESLIVEENNDESNGTWQQLEDRVHEGNLTTATKEKGLPSQLRLKHKKMDEVDLKILKALDKREPPNPQMSFFNSLLPNIENFNSNEWLQFQMEVLQVISNIKKQKVVAPYNEKHTTQCPSQLQEYIQPMHYDPQPLQQPYRVVPYYPHPPQLPPSVPSVSTQNPPTSTSLASYPSQPSLLPSPIEKIKQTTAAEHFAEYVCGEEYESSSWDEYREPIEIKCAGKYVLSDTENGKSIIFFDPKFFEEDKASELMDHLLNATNWQAKNVTIRGIEYPQPRLVAWYGPFPYAYSGVTLEPDYGMPHYVFEIKKKVERYLRKNGVDVRFNSVLLNLYRNNKDSVSWHSDDETSMGIDPTIASVSLGDTRRFEMRRKLKYFEGESSYTETDEYFIPLNNGSLLVMDGSMQKDWQHRVPKERQPRLERINLTFRTVHKVESLLRSPKAQIKKSLKRVTKIPRKKILFGKTVDADAESECSFTESNKPKEKNSKSSSKVEDQIFGDAETKRSLELVTKTHREKNSFEKALGIDLKSKGSETVCKTEDFETVIESKKPEEKNSKSSFKVEDKVCRDIETNACNHSTLKTEEKFNESDEEEDIVEVSHKKKRTKLDVKYDVKNIGSRNATTGKNKRLCISTQSTVTHSLSATVRNDFKIKTENTCSADDSHTLSESCELNTFDSCELKNLLDYNVDLMDGKVFHNYVSALKNQVLQNIDRFRLPAKAELEVLCELIHGSQTEENKKVIARRMHSVILRALKLP